MNWLRWICPVAMLAVAPGPADASLHDWSSGPVALRLWVPDDQPVVYGVFIIFNESTADTRPLVRYPEIQEWVRTIGFGIVGTDIQEVDQSATVAEGLAALGLASGHPELARAPVLADGLSLGAYNSMHFAAVFPERTIAYLAGGARGLVEDTSAPGFATTPGLFYLGENDTDLDDGLERALEMLDFRARGAQIGYFIQWDRGHERGYADDIGRKFFADVVSLRYPQEASPADGPIELIDIPLDHGWLADPATWQQPFARVTPFADYPDTPESAFWLPTRDFAFVYRGHATQQALLSFDSPAPPRDWLLVDPGDPVEIEVTAGGLLTQVVAVDVFDGSVPIAHLTSAPFRTAWTAEGIGVHALVSVASLSDGSQRTGLASLVLVRGTAAPGGGSLDDGGQPDAGPGGGGDGDGDGGSDDDSDDDEGSDDSGAEVGAGCGCRAGSDRPATSGALAGGLALIFFIGFRRRRRASPPS